MTLLRKRLALLLLLGSCAGLTSSCQTLGPLVGGALAVPFQLAGQILSMAASNPVGTAAAAAAAF